jgi:hypothetical protein
MSVQFHVNQKVVCIDAGQFSDRISNGSIYTVSAVGENIGNLYLGLEETTLVKPLQWRAKRFRPVVERKTSIECFQAMLITPKVGIPA